MSRSVFKSPFALAAVAGLLAGAGVLAKPFDAHSQDYAPNPDAQDSGGFGCMVMGQPCDVLAVPETAAPPVNFSVDPVHAKAVTEKLCVGCHALDVVQEQKKSRDAWWATMETMKSYGMEATDEQRAEILEYLSANYHG